MKPLYKRWVVTAFIVALFCIVSGCSAPILFTELSYSAAFRNHLNIMTSFEINEVPEYDIDNSQDPFLSFGPPSLSSSQLFVKMPDGSEELRVMQLDTENSLVPLENSDPIEIKYRYDDFVQLLQSGYSSSGSEAWYFSAASMNPDNYSLRFTGPYPIQNSTGPGLLMVASIGSGYWELQLLTGAFYDSTQPFMPLSQDTTNYWTFSDPSLDFATNYSAEGFVTPTYTDQYQLVGFDAQAQDDDYFSYLFYFADTAQVYEAVAPYDFDVSDTLNPVLTLGTPFLAARVNFDLDEFTSTNPTYYFEGHYRSNRTGSKRRGYFSVIELDSGEYETFGWDSGDDNSGLGTIDTSEPKLIEDKKGPIPGKLLDVLNDGTLLFEDSESGTWILYREGDARRKEFNPGEIRFVREFLSGGTYYISLSGLYRGNDSNGINDEEAKLTFRDETYVIRSDDFLDFVGY